MCSYPAETHTAVKNKGPQLCDLGHTSTTVENRGALHRVLFSLDTTAAEIESAVGFHALIYRENRGPTNIGPQRCDSLRRVDSRGKSIHLSVLDIAACVFFSNTTNSTHFRSDVREKIYDIVYIYS